MFKPTREIYGWISMVKLKNANKGKGLIYLDNIISKIKGNFRT